MKDKIEEHWKNSNQLTCNGKLSFPSYRKAAEYNHHIHKRGSAARAKGKKLEKMHPYRCKRCNNYHIGHDIRNRQARLKQAQLRQQTQRHALRWEQDASQMLE